MTRSRDKPRLTKEILALLLVSVPLAAGCGVDEVDGKRTLESSIREKLPRQVQRTTGLTVAPDPKVSCIEPRTNEFDCFATITVGDGSGSYKSSQGQSQRIPISGSCDDEGCQWRAE